MASEKKLIDSSTSFHQSDALILCANDCGFFGTPSTLNLCSKCYRDYKMREEQAVTAISAVEKSMASVPPLEVGVDADEAAEELVPAVLDGSSSSSVDVAPPQAKPANRCGSYNKKVGVMGFMCRCGSTLCGS